MPRPPSKHPTDGELEILRILWGQGPLSLSTLVDVLRKEREVAITTVATMLKVMLDKGLVHREGSGRGAEWSATITQKATAKSLVGKLVDGLFEGSAEQLVLHLVETKRLGTKQLNELESLLAEAKQKRPKGGTR